MNKTLLNLKSLVFSYLLLSGLSNPIEACTTIIAGKNATLEGKTIIARTSDTIDARRAKSLKLYASNAYIGLPYWDLEFDEKNDMAQVATNQYGVALSATETIQSSAQSLLLDPPSTSKHGVAEPNIPNIIMPSAKSARHAVEILGKAIEERGVEGTKGLGVLFADKEEAWYLETLSGHQWVAIKIPEDVYFVAANGPGQIQAYLPNSFTYKFSHFNGKTPIEFATENNMAQATEKGDFDFRETFANVNNAANPRINFVRIAYLQHHFNPHTHDFNLSTINKGKFPIFLEPENKITVTEVQKLFASHYEEFPEFDPYLRHNKDETKRAFYYPISNVRTSNAHVTVVGAPLAHKNSSIANVEYIALGMPMVSFYLPIYYGISHTPHQLMGSTNQADLGDEKLFWQFRKLQVLVFLSDPIKNIDFEPKKRLSIIQKQFEILALEIEQDRLTMEKEYAKTLDSTLIDNFMENSIIKLSNLNRQLTQKMMALLGIEAKYGLKDEEAKVKWFTAKVREQDCNYRTDHCQSKLLNTLNPLVDGPIL